MAEDTLLTFWPPAPCERMAESIISLSGIKICGVMVNIVSVPSIISNIGTYILKCTKNN